MRTIYKGLLVGSAFLALVSIVLSISLFGTKMEGMFALPLCFLVFTALIGSVTWGRVPSPFLSICFATAFLRYVAFPALVSILGGYEGRSWTPPADQSYDLAVVLMCYEVLAVGALVAYLERNYQRDLKPLISLHTTALPAWYLLGLALVAVILVVLFPQSLSLLSVGSFEAGTDETFVPATAVAVAMILMTVKVFLFVKLLRRIGNLRRWRWAVPWLAVLLGAANIVIYFGTNRLAMVLAAIATVWLIFEIFGRRASLSVGLLLVVAVLTFSALTERRDYARFSSDPLLNLADTVQGYTGGVYNVAVGVEVAETYPQARSFAGLAYDFVRPTAGLNLITQNWNFNYSNIYFNWRMFTHVDRRSQIMPMIAQGNLYFHEPLAPILSIFFVWLAYRLQSLISAASYIEIKYALLIVVLRLGFFWGQNSMNLMNFISLHLIIPLSLMVMYFAAKQLGKRHFDRIAHVPRRSM